MQSSKKKIDSSVDFKFFKLLHFDKHCDTKDIFKVKF